MRNRQRKWIEKREREKEREKERKKEKKREKEKKIERKREREREKERKRERDRERKKERERKREREREREGDRERKKERERENETEIKAELTRPTDDSRHPPVRGVAVELLLDDEGGHASRERVGGQTPSPCTRKRNVLLNDALNTFYLRLYGVRHMVKREREMFYLTTHSTHFI